MDLDPSIVWDFAGEVVGTLRPASRAVPATVTRIDADGTVWATVGDGMEAPAASSSVGLSVGDEVSVQWSGARMSVTGNVSDPSAGVRAVGAVRHAAQAAQRLAEDAKAVADATGQYFWHDANGAHVSNEKDNATAAQNSVWNSLGMLFRSGANNLLAIVTGTDPGMDVYDGQGNADANTVASFRGSSARVGRADSMHVEVTDSGVTFYDGEDRMEKLTEDGLYYGWRSDVGEPVAETSFSDFGDEWNLRNAIGSRESTKHASIYNYAERCWISDANRMDSAEVAAVTRNADGIPESSIQADSGFGGGNAGHTARIAAIASSSVGTAYAYADRVQVEDPITGNTFDAFPTHGVVAQGTNVPASGYHDFNVSFGHTYAAAPTVQLTILSSSTATTFNCDIYLRSVSTTEFTARIVNRESSDRSPGFNWLAIG